MTGTEFERHMAAVLRRRGYSVTITGASGDKGADLVVRRHKWSPLIVVQLKRYKGSVGVAAVQQAFGARTYYRADEAWVATTGRFTRAAEDYARRTGVVLIDRVAMARRWGV